MTLILSNEDVGKLVTMHECIDVLDDAYREFAQGRGISRWRSDSVAPNGRDGGIYALKSMDGVAPKLGVSAVRINSDIISWPKVGNSMRRVKVPAAPGDRYVGLVLLFACDTGEPLAILPDGVLQRMRVGATNGLGVKYMARRDAASVGILGSGWQAGTQLAAVCAVRDIKTIRCFSPSKANREAFATEMSATLGIDVVPVEAPEAAVGGADIVMCASNSLDNIFFERYIEPGMHLTSIKRPEIETRAVERADRLVIHSHDEKPLLYTTEGLDMPEYAEEKGWGVGSRLDFDALPTLPQLVTGEVPGRGADEEVTCFLNNIGLGYQFAAAGALVYRKAKEAGAGHELPTDWFTEDVHP
jgi:ornithine cyclodeaminase/alanine dehydrogenase-like protein (mu-crystallin family)